MRDYHSNAMSGLTQNKETSCEVFYFCHKVNGCMYYTYQPINEIKWILASKSNVNT